MPGIIGGTPIGGIPIGVTDAGVSFLVLFDGPPSIIAIFAFKIDKEIEIAGIQGIGVSKVSKLHRMIDWKIIPKITLF